jgi:hypothetical protein
MNKSGISSERNHSFTGQTFNFLPFAEIEELQTWQNTMSSDAEGGSIKVAHSLQKINIFLSLFFC